MGLIRTALVSPPLEMQVVENTVLMELGQIQRHTQNPPVLSTLGVRLSLPAPA